MKYLLSILCLFVLSCNGNDSHMLGVCVQQNIELIDGNWTCYPNYLEVDCINQEFDNLDYIWIVDMDCQEFCEEVQALDNNFINCDINDLES